MHLLEDGRDTLGLRNWRLITLRRRDVLQLPSAVKEDECLFRWRHFSLVICSSNDGGACAAVPRLIKQAEASLARWTRAPCTPESFPPHWTSRWRVWCPAKRWAQPPELSVVLKGSVSSSGLRELTFSPPSRKSPSCYAQQGGKAGHRTRTAAGLDWVSQTIFSFMAVARKIKTLLTVNILVFVGIILFSVYCRIQDRSEELIQIGRLSDQRLRARNGKVSNLVDRQSILQRLERLEDVVYNQLNGRSQLHNLNTDYTPELLVTTSPSS